MVTSKLLIAKCVIAALAAFPQLSAAEEFKSARVLEWSEDSQNSLFQSSVTMIGIVASQRDDTSHIARCIDEWYSEETQGRRQDHIRNVMTEYPDFHPQAIILAVVEKACGQFEGT